MWLKNLALVGASVLFSLLLIELMLRLLGWSYPLFAQPDTELGWSFRPNLSGWSTHEGTAYLRINRFGYRGPDWPDRPAADRYRIALVGDSFVDSSNLDRDHTLPNTIERSLAACPALAGQQPEVLNFGVSGYGTAQEYLMLQERVAPRRPKLVVLVFYVGNDVTNNSRTLSAADQKTKPYFTVLPSGELRLDNSFVKSEAFRHNVRSDWIKRLINRSYLLQALKQAYLRRPIMPSQPAAPTKADPHAEKLPSPNEVQLFSPPDDEEWRAAWAVTEKLLLRIRDWSRQQGVALALVLIPDPVQSLPFASLRQAAAKASAIAELDYPSQRIAAFAEQNGIRTLDLLASFKAYGDRTHEYLYGFPPKLGDGHLNATGTQVGGKLIANWLCPALAP